MNDDGLNELQTEIKTIISRVDKPEKMLITAGMPYANGQLHIGHLAGTHVPSDIYARFYRMLIGKENVLHICGSDDHGSTSEISARNVGKDVKDFIREIHAGQTRTLNNYNIDLDIYTGTSREEVYEIHKNFCQNFLIKLYKNGMLKTKTSEQWFDPDANLFLPDRFINGTCPKCGKDGAYSEECDSCGGTYEAKELINPISKVSGGVPVLKPTDHWWLDMWQLTDELKNWFESKEKTWRKFLLSEVLGTVTPGLVFSKEFEEKFKSLKGELPKHKSKYIPGKNILIEVGSLSELETTKSIFEKNQIHCEENNSWAYRSITRDVNWGIPLPTEVDPKMKGKTFYVWPESLIAPISFTQLALKNKGKSIEKYEQYWKNPKAKVSQFIGVDNVFFYTVMQGAMWFGTQDDKHRLPIDGELQLTDVFPLYHLQINDQKMSKSTGNFYTGDQLIDDMGYSADQVRYFLSVLSLHKKQSNFDFKTFDERNNFLAGPMNAAFERPISAARSKFKNKVPQGKLVGKSAAETKKMIQMYVKFMEKAQYSDMLFALENYARLINKIFVNHRPHDDRHPEAERADGLFTCFYILKNLMIMLYPVVPSTMEKLRQSLNLPSSVFSISELGVPIEVGHEIGEIQEFFPHTQESKS